MSLLVNDVAVFETVLQLCHRYKVRELRATGMRVTFSDDAFVRDEPPQPEPNQDPDERELSR